MAHPTGPALRLDNHTYAEAVQEIEHEIRDLNQEVQDLVFGRFYAIYHQGVYDPVQGRTYLRTSGRSDLENSSKIATFCNTQTVVKNDSKKTKQIIVLFNNHAPLSTIHIEYSKLSNFARKEIEEHLTKVPTTPHNASMDQLRIAIEALDRKMQ